MPDASIELLAAQFERVREWSLLCCRGVTVEHATTVPPGAGNHILWELGHICLTRNYLITWGCGGGSKLSEGWHELFGFGSQVLARAEDYPSLAEVIGELKRGGQALKDYIRTLSVEELNSPSFILPKHIFPSRQAAFVHLLSHEAYHVGKLSLLRKLLGLRTISELYFEH